MKSNLKQLAMFFCIGAVMVFGMRVAEWLILKPEVKLMICVVDAGDSENDCRYFDEFKAGGSK